MEKKTNWKYKNNVNENIIINLKKKIELNHNKHKFIFR